MAYSDRLEGEILRFTFRAPERGFAVARMRIADATEVTVVGPIAGLHEGQRIAAEGQWGMDAKFGKQFKVEKFLVEDPRTMRGMEKYLASALPGVHGESIVLRLLEERGLGVGMRRTKDRGSQGAAHKHRLIGLDEGLC